MENRRDFLRMSVLGAAVGLAGSGEPVPAEPGRPAEWLFQPLEPGSAVGLGWRLGAVAPATAGAVTVRLVHEDGRSARVDVCLREGAPRGPAFTANLDFIVMDGGDGGAPMDEPLGRAVRRLAEIVAANEDRDLAALSTLLPHADRAWRHPASLVVPRSAT